MVNWLPIIPALLGVAPAAALFFAAYGRYDGAFRDNVVFLYFMGGLLVGGVLGFVSLFLISSQIGALLLIVGLALLIPVTVVMCVNRRKWQGERHAVFNGGALGLGMAVMMSFSIVYYHLNAAAASGGDATAIAWDPTRLIAGVLLATGLAGLLFALGLLAGDGVRRRAQLKTAFAATAIALAPVVFLEEYINSGGTWFWGGILAAYGAIVAFAADRRLLIQGVDDVARRARRRARRRAG